MMEFTEEEVVDLEVERIQDEGEVFGQSEPLADRLKSLLELYPPGTQVFKEILQNADDAGASCVHFLLDLNHYPAEPAKLLSSTLARFQGVALCAYNDAVFREEDYVSLSRLGNSLKKKTLNKIGRFGLGWSSVYHITDLPSFVSTDKFVILDPHEKYLGSANHTPPGRRYNFVQHSLHDKFPDQFAPYKFLDFNIASNTPLQGTLFRFPLRTAQLAKHSRLSQEAYSGERMKNELLDFKSEAAESLLFLQSVHRITVSVREAPLSSPRVLYEVCLELPEQSLMGRRFLSDHLQSEMALASSPQPSDTPILSTCFQLTTRVTSENPTWESERGTEWTICGGFRRRDPHDSTFTPNQNEGRRFVPWASIAADISAGCGPAKGRLFCFLPLPMHTGLPVHVNGFFALSPNRRNLLSGDDLKGEAYLNKQWNEYLLSKLVPHLYMELLLSLRSLNMPPAQFFSLWPTEPSALANFPSTCEAFFQTAYRSDCATTTGAPPRWVTPLSSYLDNDGGEGAVQVRTVLAEGNLDLVSLPSQVAAAFSHFHKAIPPVTPLLLLDTLRAALTLPSLTQSPSRQDLALALLEYALPALSPHKPSLLGGVLLLGVADGSVVRFTGGCYPSSRAAACSTRFLLPDPRYLDLIAPSSRSQVVAPCFNRLVRAALHAGQHIDVVDMTGHQLRSLIQPTPQSSASPPSLDDHRLALLWNLIAETKTPVQVFSDWPILRTSTGSLRCPVPSSRIFSVFPEDASLATDFEMLGFSLLAKVPWTYPDELCSVTFSISFHSVLQAFATFHTGQEHKGDREMFPALRQLKPASVRRLRSFLAFLVSRDGTVSEFEATTLRALPIHEMYDDCRVAKSESSVFQAIAHGPFFMLSGEVRPVASNPLLLSFTSGSEDAERALYRAIGVPTMSVREYALAHVYPHAARLDPSILTEFTLRLLDGMWRYEAEQPGFLDRLCKVQFLPSADASMRLCTPPELYDPADPELQQLSLPPYLIPAPSFQSHSVLASLRRLGLSRNLTAADFLKCIEAIEVSNAILPCSSLLQYLQRHLSSLVQQIPATSPGWSVIHSSHWLPPWPKPPSSTLPWYQPLRPLCSPKECRPSRDLLLCCSVLPVVELVPGNSPLVDLLRWNDPCPLHTVLDHVRNLHSAWRSGATLQADLDLAFRTIYEHLQESASGLIPSVVSTLRTFYQSGELLWTGKCFVGLENAVVCLPVDLSPFVSPVSLEYRRFSGLFKILGVLQEPSMLTYSNVLQQLLGACAHSPLNQAQVDLAVNVLTLVSELKSLPESLQLPVLCSDDRMRPASEVVFDDLPVASFGATLKGNVYNLHPKISRSAAKSLHMRMKSEVVFSDASPDELEDYGQEVKLTSRIHDILRDYGDDDGDVLIKELLQNADDAGATEVRFLIDSRAHATKDLISEPMRCYQGPALVVYNNATFSEDDFRGILRVGHGGKGQGPGQQRQRPVIGRFGIGWNSVYSVTDVPSFASGEYVVFFDPHERHLPRRADGLKRRGIRVNVVQKDLASAFPGQFKPFSGVFGWQPQAEYNGSLVRLPLRSREMARESEISHKAVSIPELEGMLRSSMGSMVEKLLFLHNIHTVIWYSSSDTGELQEHRCVRLASCKILNMPSSQSSLVQPTTNQRASFHRVPPPKDGVVMSSLRFTASSTPPCGNAADNNSEEWVVCHAPVAMPTYFTTQRYFSSASVAVAICVATRDRAVPTSTLPPTLGRVYCFLPLPLLSQLPCHIHGTFAVRSDRRHLIQSGEDSDGQSAAWNSFLLQKSIPPIFAELLEYLLHTHHGLGLSPLLPSVTAHREPYLQPCAKAMLLAASSRNIFRTGLADRGELINGSDGWFWPSGQSQSLPVPDALTRAGVPVILIDEASVSNLTSAGACVRLLTPSAVRQILRSLPACCVEPHLKLELLMHCLSDGEYQDLVGVPLLYTMSGACFSFQTASSSPTYFVVEPAETHLVTQAASRIVSTDIAAGVKSALGGGANINVRRFDVAALAELLPLQLPASWKDADLDPSSRWSELLPSPDWLDRFWAFVQRARGQLGSFERWPLLRTMDGSLCCLRPLSRSSLVDSAICVRADVPPVLQAIGCKVLRPECVPADHSLSRAAVFTLGPRLSLLERFPSLAQYVHRATVAGVTAALYACLAMRDPKGSDLECLFQGVPRYPRAILFRYFADLSHSENLSDTLRSHIHAIPFFRTASACIPATSTSLQFRSFRSGKDLPHWAPSPYSVPFNGHKLFRAPDRDSVRFLEALGFSPMQLPQFVSVFLLPYLTNMSTQDLDSCMLQVMADLPQILRTEPSMANKLSSAAFVPVDPANERVRKAPCELLNPMDDWNQKLFEGQNVFPIGQYTSSPSVLDALKTLGMKNSPSVADVVAQAHQIASLTDIERATRLSCNLFGFLNQQNRAAKFLQDPSLASLRGIKFLVRAHTPAFTDMTTTLFVSPSESRPKSDDALCGTVVPLADVTVTNPLLQSVLGWNVPVKPDVVIKELNQFLQSFTQSPASKLSQAVVRAKMMKIYAALDAAAAQGSLTGLASDLQQIRWYWTGHKFVSVQKIACRSALNLEPELHVVSKDIAVFSGLLRVCGVKQAFGEEDLVWWMERQGLGQEQPKPLPPERLQLYVSVLTELKCLSCPFAKVASLALPNCHRVLMPRATMVFNDQPEWLQYSDEKLLHGSVSKDLALWLRVTPATERLVADSITSEGFQAFEQEENPTMRLSNILKDHLDDELSMFQELLQNADDAGATEVRFLFDQQRHPTRSLFNPAMAAWQGPALLVYNDATFSNNDFTRIIQLGMGHRPDLRDQLGLVRLGFNACYHFTDLPSFVSGEHLVCFDPHQLYLPPLCALAGSSGTSPVVLAPTTGKRRLSMQCNFVAKDLASKFPDQFLPYRAFGHNLHKPFPGTLFRLPLRPQALCSTSKISQNAPSAMAAVTFQLDRLGELAPEMLLFLQQVRRISGYVIDNIHTTPQLRFSTNIMPDHADPSIKARKIPDPLSQHLPDSSSPLLAPCISSVSIEVVRATGLRETRSQQRWVICSSGGDKRLYELSQVGRRFGLGLTPFGSCALRLFPPAVEDRVNSSFQGRMFALLPIPDLLTHLPVHVNGSFALTPNRRSLVSSASSDILSTTQSKWNLALASNLLGPAYAYLLLHCTEHTLLTPTLMYSLWPSPQKSPRVPSYISSLRPSTEKPSPLSQWMSSLCVSFLATAKDLPLLRTTTKMRVTASEAVFRPPDLPDDVADILIRAGTKIVDCPSNIPRRFESASISIVHVTPEFVRTSLRAIGNASEIVPIAAWFQILRYILTDRPTTSLEHVPALIRADLTRDCFSAGHDRLYVSTTTHPLYKLFLPYCPHSLLHPQTPDDICTSLLRLADTFQLVTLSSASCCPLIEQVLQTLLPQDKQRLMLQLLELHQVSFTEFHHLSPHLRSLSLIPTVADLARPSDLYDPTVFLFQHMFLNQPRFPIGPFASPHILAALRALGLQTLSSPAAILACAEALQAILSSDVPDPRASELANQIGAATEQVLLHLPEDDHDFLARLQAISFIPTHQAMEEPLYRRCSQAMARRHTSVAASFEAKDIDLVFIVRPIRKDIFPAAVKPHLASISEPPLGDVLDNLISFIRTHACRLLLERHTSTRFVRRVLKHCLAFLSLKSAQNVSQQRQIRVALESLPCVLVRDQLVVPSQIDLDMRQEDEEHSTGVFALPDKFQRFKDLLRTLGAIASVTEGRALVQKKPFNFGERISMGLLNQLASGVIAPDVVLVTADGDVPAHAVVLCAMSPHFCSVLSCGMLESHLRRIPMEEESRATADALVEYLYSGDIGARRQLDAQLLIDLLRLGDLYDMEHLTSLCEFYMVHRGFLTYSNSMDVLTHARAYHAQQLEAAASRKLSAMS